MYSNVCAIRVFLLASGATLILPVAALANPSGATVTTGSASISQSSLGKTTINQTSQGVVIDWSSFNIGTGQTTQFVQPNSSAIAVNRIGGASASQILGTLDANGRIVLINGNGLLFGKGAKVNVGSLIATSTDDSDSNVLVGKFSQAGSQSASVVNQGRINASSGGVVALVAPSVTNAGIVNAKLGTVALGAANKFTIDFSGDGLVSFASQGDVTGAAQAINTGQLSGANVSMTAHAAEGLATGVVTMHGTITAHSAHQAGGVIVLDAGDGTLSTTGTLNAAGSAGGGSIETSGGTAEISGNITAGAGGQWLVDPDNLTIDAAASKTIDKALRKDNNVTLRTTATGAKGVGVVTPGAGDIDIDSQIAWNTSATLTIDAYHSINVLAPIKVVGAGTLSLTTNTSETDGVLNFSVGYAAFSEVVDGTTQGSLLIDGSSFTLENNLHSLAAAIASDAAGNFALAKTYNAHADGTYSSSVITTTFDGSFTGLGNTISNLSINDTAGFDNVGLFSKIGDSGNVSGLVLSGGHVRGGFLANVGAIAGENDNTIENVHSSVAVSDGDNSNVGGLAGDGSFDLISQSYDTGTVTAGGQASYAGGLIGRVSYGTITYSYSTGALTGGRGATIGGLAGSDFGGVISNTYATGLVSGGRNAFAGGLVGSSGTAISNSYATGAVTGGFDAIVGGLVGGNSSSIIDSYSSGRVTNSGEGNIGGLVGHDYNFSSENDSYWDMTSSGVSNASQGVGNIPNEPGVTGLTTIQLQSGLPSGFDTTIWGANASINGGLPYLLALAPS